MSERVLRLRRHALDWRVLDDEVVMLDAEQSSYLATNSSGTLLWQELDRGATRTGLINLLVERFAIDPSQATTDIDAFLAELGDRGLLEES